MRIHLVRSAEVSKDRYTRILGYLQSFRGPMSFMSSEFIADPEVEDEKPVKWSDKMNPPDVVVPKMAPQESMKFNSEIERLEAFGYRRPVEVKKLKWNKFFDKADDYRIKNDLGKDEFVVILTDLGNEENWFSAPDSAERRNIFVQTSGWGFYLEGESTFPVSSQILSNVLRFFMADGWSDFHSLIHMAPRGCMNDFCENKHDVIMHLRTADLCPDCIQRFADRKVDAALISQAFEIMESVRRNVLFRERLNLTHQPSRIRITGPKYTIDFSDLPNSELKLTPLEKTVYLLFLKHPEGILFNSLSDHKEEVRRLYEQLNPNIEPHKLEESVEALVEPLSQSLSEKIAKIKSKLNSLLGSRLAEYYVISGGSSQVRKIGIDRSLVDWGVEA